MVSCYPQLKLFLVTSVFPQVQLQLLTAIVKLFLKKPTETQELVQQVLSLATQVGAPASPLCPAQLLFHKGPFSPRSQTWVFRPLRIHYCGFGASMIQKAYSGSSAINKSRWNGVRW